MIKSDDLAKIRDCELTITFELDIMKSYSDAVEVANDQDIIVESLAFSDNSLAFKFVQNIDKNYFKKHIESINENSRIFFDDESVLIN